MRSSQKILSILREVIPSVSDMDTQSNALVIGLTGVGKSTIINYLLGYSMQKSVDELVEPIDEKIPVPMGNGVGPITIFPASYKSAEGVTYCEFPSFTNISDKDIKICSIIATEYLVKRNQTITAILVIIDYDTILTQYGNSLKKLADIFGNLLIDPDAVAPSILFILNKCPPNIPKNEIADRIQKIMQNEEKKLGELRNILNRFVLQIERGSFTKKEISSLKKNILESYRISSILKLLLKYFNTNFININIFDHGETRIEIVNKILEAKPIDVEQFNFSNSDSMRVQFDQAMENIIFEAIQTARQFDGLQKAIVIKHKELQKSQQQIKFYHEQLTTLYTHRSQDIQQPVVANRQQSRLRQNGNDLQENKAKINSLQNELKQSEIELSQLDEKTPVVYWSQSINEDYSIMPRAISFVMGILVPGGNLATDVALYGIQCICNLLYEGKKFYYADIPFVNVECKKSTGEFLDEYSKPAEGLYRVTYKADLFNKREAVVKIYCEKNKIPINQLQIEKLKNKIELQNNLLKKIIFETEKLGQEKSLLTASLQALEARSKIEDFHDLQEKIEQFIRSEEKFVQTNKRNISDMQYALKEMNKILPLKMEIYFVVRDIMGVLYNNKELLNVEFFKSLEILYPLQTANTPFFRVSAMRQILMPLSAEVKREPQIGSMDSYQGLKKTTF